MKRKLVKKIVALVATTTLALGMLAGCGESAEGGNDGAAAPAGTEAAPVADDAAVEVESLVENPVGGKILYMSNIQSGPAYDYYAAEFEMLCENLGYEGEIIFGDMANDPKGNLDAVKAAYTSDVVGLIMGQDGGVIDILNEYPDLWVAGFNSDMASVYDEEGASHAALENPHFLGAMGDNYISGVDTAADFFNLIMEKGFKKISIITFPPFAYPQHTVADVTLRGMIDEYNASAADEDKIEVVGDTEVLMFAPLADDYFMDAAHQDLDAIIGICAGTQFIYATMLNAKISGTCAERTQLLTGGFELAVLEDCGDDKNIGSVRVAMPESFIWPVAMIDSALQGVMYADYTAPERMDSGILSMTNDATFQAVIDNCPYMDADLSKNIYSWADIQQMLPRYNADATYADLCKKLTEDLTVECYMQ